MATFRYHRYATGLSFPLSRFYALIEPGYYIATCHFVGRIAVIYCILLMYSPDRTSMIPHSLHSHVQSVYGCDRSQRPRSMPTL